MVVFLGPGAARRREHSDPVQIGRLTEVLARRILVPSTVAILILGVSMVWAE